MIDRRPISGSGSCARCRASLGLASLKHDGIWYCTNTCAAGRISPDLPEPVVPEPWLYARPRRFFGKRKPKELRSTRSSR